MPNHWDLVPPVDFTEQTHWKSLGDNRWGALRLRFLYVASKNNDPRPGPVFEKHPVDKGQKITIRMSRQKVVTHTESATDAVRVAATERISEQLAAKVSSELAAKAPGFSGKLQSELSSTSEREFTTEVERTLTRESSHSLEDTQGREYEFELDGKDGAQEAKFRRLYWPKQWDVYLHSYDYLELSYRRTWPWKRIRRTMKRVDGQALGWPLLSITFFEPQADPVVLPEPVANEIDNPEAYVVQPLTAAMPSSPGPKLQDLEAAARLAFPASRAEKAAAKARKRPTRGAEGIGFAKGAPRRKVKAKKAKRAAPVRKRRGSKKAARKAAPKRRKQLARRKK